MLNSALTGAFKLLMQMVVWVFILSISWNGRTLFDRAHSVLVDNVVVEEVDAQLGELWDSMTRGFSVALDEKGEDKIKETF